MDELSYYEGRHTGQEIDSAVDRVINASEDVESGNSNLVTSDSVYTALADEIFTVNLTGLTGTGDTVTKTYTFVPSGSGYNPTITAYHVVLAYSFSNPAAVVEDLTVTTGNQSITVSGKVNGTTGIALRLGRYSKAITLT